MTDEHPLPRPDGDRTGHDPAAQPAPAGRPGVSGKVWSFRTVAASAITAVALSGFGGAALAAASDGGSSDGPSGRGGFGGPPGRMGGFAGQQQGQPGQQQGQTQGQQPPIGSGTPGGTGSTG